MSDLQKTHTEESIDHVFGALREAAPAPGLEGRVLKRLADARACARSPRWPAWAVPATLAACALAALLFLPLRQKSTQSQPQAHHQARISSQSTKDVPFQPEQNSYPVPPSRETLISNRERSCGAHALHVLCAKIDISAPTAETASADTATLAAKVERNPQRLGASASVEASYPAPELPLTEQERLLIQIAHRNDPVLMAALDPAARELEIARDHAETKRFFTPPPRPPEIQREIDAAVASQYAVNLNKDRTLP